MCCLSFPEPSVAKEQVVVFQNSREGIRGLQVPDNAQSGQGFADALVSAERPVNHSVASI